MEHAMTKILMFSGSIRKESLNKKLITATAKIAKKKAAEVNLIDLADYPMPIYNGDFEDEYGVPENAQKLYKLIEQTDAILISSPEYNGLPSPLLKNTIDWISRLEGNVYSGKIAAIISASIGGLGGMRGLTHLHTLLNNLDVTVIPNQLSVGEALDAFDSEGNLKNEHHKKTIESIIDVLILEK